MLLSMSASMSASVALCLYLWYRLGNLTAADAPRILDAVSSASKIEITPTSTPREKPPLIADPAHWRGRMGFTKERQIEFMDSHLEEQQTTNSEQ